MNWFEVVSAFADSAKAPVALPGSAGSEWWGSKLLWMVIVALIAGIVAFTNNWLNRRAERKKLEKQGNCCLAKNVMFRQPSRRSDPLPC